MVASGGRAYVLAGGGDDGVSLFVLLDSGRLVYLDSLADGAVPGLANVSALAAVAQGEEVRVFAASQEVPGLSELVFSIAGQGVNLRAADVAEMLSGTSGDDILHGGAGDDDLRGGAGDDILSDGAGVDALSGGAGRDIFVLTWDAAGDRIVDFEPGADRLDLSEFPMLYAPSQLGYTPISGGALLEWRGQVTEVMSLSGQVLTLWDILAGGFSGPDRPPLGTGAVITGGPGADVLGGGWGADALSGAAGNDLLQAGDGADSLYGGGGFDTLLGGNGADRLWGGNGRDLAYMGAGDDIFSDNGQTGGTGSDTVFGGAGDDTVRGGAGADRFYGLEGHDILFAGLGADSLYGGAGFDTLYGGNGTDRLWGGDGRERVYAGAGDDVFIDNGQVGDLGRDTVYGGPGNDSVYGGAGADAFHGMEGADLLFGRKGADHLFGGAGEDALYGGKGDDRLFDGPGADTLAGGWGADVFVFSADASPDRITDFTPGQDRIQLTGTGLEFDNLVLTAGADALRIGGGTDVLWLDGLTTPTALDADDFLFL